MLRAVSSIYLESQAFLLLSSTRRDLFKVFRTGAHSATISNKQIVLNSEGVKNVSGASAPAPPPAASAPPGPPLPPPPPSPRPRRSWTMAAALALTASIGGIYFYRKLTDEEKEQLNEKDETSAGAGAEAEDEGVSPALSSMFPAHVQYLLVGAGTASFAAMRALRSLRPEALVLLVGEERAPPYMRPPLSKELWREPDLAARARHPDALTFTQWNGRRRSVVYEPLAFYTPVEELAECGGGAAVARGWRVTRLDVERHSAELAAPGQPPVTVTYDRCLIATGSRPARVSALAGASAAGLSVCVRSLQDAAALATALERPHVRRVVIVGGGFLASELSAALAHSLTASGRTVMQLYREESAMSAVLPQYLAADASRRLAEAGVTLLPRSEVADAEVRSGRVLLRLASGACVEADLVVECVGSEPNTELSASARLEVHPELGGVVVNAELQARTDVFAAGDVACFHDVSLGRRRVEHHDHAVVSGRLAGENMAAAPGASPAPRPYTHQSMFWSDLGPQLGYEAIGIIDSRLPTVGVFSADAVSDATAAAQAVAEAGAAQPVAGAGADEATSRRYERGVVFYLREKRVVGVLLWNLFNRMHIARQVLAQGEFEDLFEVAKLFSPHEED